MTTIQTLRKDVSALRERTGFRPTVILHMWLPPDDPRHAMTDREIIAAQSHHRLIIVPLCVRPHP